LTQYLPECHRQLLANYSPTIRQLSIANYSPTQGLTTRQPHHRSPC
jgi:hypothetical protein